jgi:hypothetical protein
MRNELLTGIIPGASMERTVLHTNYGALSGNDKVNLAINEVLAIDKASASKVNADGGVSLFFGPVDLRAPEWVHQQLDEQKDTVVAKPDSFWKRQKRNAVAAAAVVTTTLPFFSGAPVAEAAPANQTQNIGKGECIPAKAPGLAVGDLHRDSNTGPRLYLFPQTGNNGNMTWIDQDTVLCGGENGGKYRPNADQAYFIEQQRVMTEKGCQQDSGCDGIRVWRYPEAQPVGREGCVNNTDLTSHNPIEGIKDWLICRTEGQEKDVKTAEWCDIQGDGAVVVNGQVKFVPDSDKKTAQYTRIHTTEPTAIRSQWELDVECIGAPFDMSTAEERNEEKIRLLKGTHGSVNVVDVFPGGGVTVTRR